MVAQTLQSMLDAYNDGEYRQYAIDMFDKCSMEIWGDETKNDLLGGGGEIERRNLRAQKEHPSWEKSM